ncbi:hypothetical protein ARMGADRAFT_1101244 [Armillaria gallica]|uniref:Uncharacterized protein n=1 Tax=Armillaria gallica TaxID=47427 RepID=A0A2H3C8Y2_ARMGA|nr:hypothetical protein ARMGADRAFT_1101244 [Armillaria gallica]
MAPTAGPCWSLLHCPGNILFKYSRAILYRLMLLPVQLLLTILNPELDPSSITTSCQWLMVFLVTTSALSTSVSILPTATSSVPSASTSSQDTTYEPSLTPTISSSQTTGTSLDTGGIPTSTVFTSATQYNVYIIVNSTVNFDQNFRTTTSATPSFNTIRLLLNLYIPTPSHLTESSLMGGDASTLTATTPAFTSNDSNSQEPPKTSTIIGAVIGVIGFLLILLLHRNRSPILLPSPKASFPYLQSRGMVQTLRKNDAAASDSADVIMSTPMNPFMVDVEGVPEADLPRKERESVTDTHRTSVMSDFNVPVASLSGGFSARGSLQILGGEQLSHPSTPGLLSHAGNNEIAEKITRLRTRIQELAIDKAPLCDQASETELPPAYVKDAY